MSQDKSVAADGALDGIAIIGMSGRFPGARSVAEFWKNQLAGVEAISVFEVAELETHDRFSEGSQKGYVRARAVLDDVDMFDAEFFGIYPREAVLMDPQQRLFLESCWEACEVAGYDPGAFAGAVGVYGGCSMPTYLLSRICKQTGFIDRFTGDYQAGSFPELLGNGLAFLATKVSYKLGLSGPSMTVLTACSTSLVAVTQACQSLLTYQCDMALAGGASISFPQKRGTHFIEGGMTSPDGHCRAFDADANGTVFGSGCAVVLLKRVEDALRDGDNIVAVIRGFAVNNDGAGKVGYTAPSVSGQARVITQAHGLAGVDPDSIGYIEAHGTGTSLGDPIEMSALTQAFRAHTDRRQFCTIGTAKTNVGHLDAAAGATGLIHAAHIVRSGTFPPTLHFKTANPRLDLENSPFRVNTETSQWPAGTTPRRAGVSAFGVGGTNAHVVIEQAPSQPARPASSGPHLLVMSARSPAALAAMRENLARHLQSDAAIDLRDVAHTLATGRKRFQHAACVVATTRDEAVAALSSPASELRSEASGFIDRPGVAFMFPGQGAQYVGMGRDLYRREPLFRAEVDKCATYLSPLIGVDLRDVIFADGQSVVAAADQLKNTALAQPAIFVVEYALARLWQSWGVEPEVLIGHSVGEFAAACLADVFSLEDALTLVAERGRMMAEAEPGGMLSVRLAPDEVSSRLGDRLSIAAVNAPKLTVVGGPHAAVTELETSLKAAGITCRRLVTSHAFHSSMMDPVVGRFRAVVERVKLSAPKLRIVSTVTGKPLEASQATDPGYWARHLREPVRFSDAVSVLRADPRLVLLEVGPGTTSSVLAQQHAGAPQTITASLAGPGAAEADSASVKQALGALWLAGVSPDWNQVQRASQSHLRKVELPTYPFERQRFWLELPEDAAVVAPALHVSPTIPDVQIVNEAAAMTEIASKSPATSAAIGSQRKERIVAAITEVFQDLAGTPLASDARHATFMELGFDSLFLTQVTRGLQNKVALKVTFRQLLGQQNTLDALADYALSALPATAFADAPATPAVATQPAPAQAAVVAPAPVSQAPQQPVAVAAALQLSPLGAVGSSSPLEQLMRDQLQAMQHIIQSQITALSGTQPAAVPQLAVPAAVVPAQPALAPVASAAVGAPVGKPATPAPADTATRSFGPFKPMEKSAAGITPHQREHIAAIVARTSKRASGSKRLTEGHRKVLADPRAVSGFRADWKEMVFPIVANRSKGAYIWDVDGNQYIDMLNGFGPIMFGHRPDFIEDALASQIGEGFEIGPQTPLAGEVAELFCELTGNERVTYCNTGSEAVMAALRLSRTVTGRDKVVLFTGDYHGMFDEVLVKAGRNRDGSPKANPIAPGIPDESCANIIVLDYGTPETLEWIKRNANDLAAVICEPVQSRRPAFQPVEFLKEVRRITLESGTALVFDEVVTGFRTHPGGCQALFGIRADLATYGKVVGGGMPIGILAGKAQFMDALDGGAWRFGDASSPEVGVTFFAGTFVRHPLTLAAVRAVLKHVKQEGPALQEKLGERTSAMVARINAVFERHTIPTRIDNFKSFMFFHFPADEKLSSLFYYLLRENGLHVLEGFPCFMTTAHTDADIDRIVAGFEAAAIEMRKGRFLSSSKPWDGDDKAVMPAAGPFRLTEPQHEVFLGAMLGEDASCAFNESFSIQMRGPLNASALTASFNEIVARHEALRASVDQGGEQMYVAPELKLDIPVIDLSAHAEGQRTVEYQRLLADDARTPFDLTNGPLIRAFLVKLDGQSHNLVVTGHHIVCDGWSTNVMLSELAALYTAKVTGAAADLPPAISFEAYANRRAADASSPEAAATEKFWVDQFKDAPAPLDLPTDRPRDSVRSSAGTTLRHRIGTARYKRIKEFGAKQGASLFATLLAGFNTLLARVSGHSDIVVGLPMAGQALEDGGNLLGHCVNFLPLRSRVAVDQPLAAEIAKVKGLMLDAYDHQSYTYGTLVRKLGVIRDPARLPLTEIQFNVEQIGEGAVFSGLTIEVEPNPKGAVNFDMFVNIVERRDGLVIDCDYNTDLFDAATIEGWLAAYESLLDLATTEPALAVRDFALPSETKLARQSGASLTADDVARLAAWNATARKFPADRSIVQLFEEQAALRPNAPAIVYGDVTLSYAELNARANRLARTIIGQGVQREELVACCLQRSNELIVAILAILKAGCGYVPLDPTLPRDRLEFMLDDTKARFTVTTSSIGFAAKGTKTILFDADSAAIAAESDANPEHRASPTALAYVIYTSGSTGRPKGVMVEHRAVVRLVRDTDYCNFGPDEVHLQNAPVSFDASTHEIWGALLNGGKLAIMPAGEPSLVELGRMIREHRVTQLFLTTGLFHLMVEQRMDDLALIKQLYAGGEVLSPRHIQEVVSKLPGTRMSAIYGPTEGTTYSTWHPFEPGAVVPESVPIGRPLSNARVYVLDAEQKLVPVGEMGELYIAGDGLARGYLNNPELTAQKFVTLQLPGGLTERLYRTGDLVRFLPDGALEFHGRIDNQIKLRGYRIELGEIEVVLQRNAAVRQGCVVPVREDGRVVRLVAFCVPTEKDRFDEKVIRDDLASSLPAYMVPAGIVVIDALPLNINGKIDRDRLLKLELAQRSRREIVAPATPDEAKLTEIVAEVMQVARIGVTDNLFEIGVDSLRVFQIASRAAKAGLNITPRTIMKARTIRATLAEAPQTGGQLVMMEIKPVARQRVKLGSTSGDGNVRRS